MIGLVKMVKLSAKGFRTYFLCKRSNFTQRKRS